MVKNNNADINNKSFENILLKFNEVTNQKYALQFTNDKSILLIYSFLNSNVYIEIFTDNLNTLEECAITCYPKNKDAIKNYVGTFEEVVPIFIKYAS